MLIEGGADPTARDKNGLTPLHFAAGLGHAEAITALIEGGADPAARNKNGLTPLHWAVVRGHADAITALIEGGADPAARDKNGFTPFDLIAEDSPLIGTPAYWRLNQARYD